MRNFLGFFRSNQPETQDQTPYQVAFNAWNTLCETPREHQTVISKYEQGSSIDIPKLRDGSILRAEVKDSRVKGHTHYSYFIKTASADEVNIIFHVRSGCISNGKIGLDAKLPKSGILLELKVEEEIIHIENFMDSTLGSLIDRESFFDEGGYIDNISIISGGLKSTQKKPTLTEEKETSEVFGGLSNPIPREG